MSFALADRIGAEDCGFAAAEASATAERLLTTLSERERRAIHLRFHQDLTQAEIAQPPRLLADARLADPAPGAGAARGRGRLRAGLRAAALQAALGGTGPARSAIPRRRRRLSVPRPRRGARHSVRGLLLAHRPPGERSRGDRAERRLRGPGRGVGAQHARGASGRLRAHGDHERPRRPTARTFGVRAEARAARRRRGALGRHGAGRAAGDHAARRGDVAGPGVRRARPRARDPAAAAVLASGGARGRRAGPRPRGRRRARPRRRRRLRREELGPRLPRALVVGPRGDVRR